MKKTILSAIKISKSFHTSLSGHSSTTLKALDNVSLQLFKNENLGIAGESGCGKSTLAKILAGLMEPDSGEVCYGDTALHSLDKAAAKIFRQKTQMIFQDPFSSLNPRMRIGDSISEPLILSGACDVHEELFRLMSAVGLPEETANRFPDEFSGGQRQRIGIARALAAKPEIIIADEPVSSLDISIQAQIINILLKLKQEHLLSMLIVSHNLLVLRHICDRIIIMYLGSIVESGPAETVFSNYRHPYTEALISAIPGLNNDKIKCTHKLHDDIPSPMEIPTGCRFHTRCRYAEAVCTETAPELTECSENHFSACHFSRRIFNNRTAES